MRKDKILAQLRKSYNNLKGQVAPLDIASETIEASHEAALVFDSKGIIELANEESEKILELNRKEIIGKNIREFLGEAFIPKNYYKYNVKGKHLKSKKLLMVKNEKAVIHRKNSTPIAVLLSISKTAREESFEGMKYCCFMKETNQMQKSFSITSNSSNNSMTSSIASKVEEKVLESNQEFRSSQDIFERITAGIIDASFDAMFSIDERGIILMVNKAASKVFGWTEEEFLGNNIKMIMGKNHAKNHDEYLKHYMFTKTKKLIGTQRELEAMRKDGTFFPVMLGLSEVEIDGSFVFAAFVRDLTLQKEHEKEVKQKERLTSSILDAAFDPLIAINEKGIISMVNDATVKKFGWEKDILIGSNIKIIMEDDRASQHDQYLANYCNTGIKNVIGKKRELTARKKNGDTFPIELGIAEATSEENEERTFCGFIRDLTQQKQHEKALNRKERLTTSILEASFDPLLLINERGIIHMANDAATRQFGWTREEFIGSNVNIIMEEDRAKHHNQYLSNYLKTGTKKVIGKKRELVAKRKDGTTFPIELGIVEAKVDDNDDRMFCGFIRDLSRQKQDELEINLKQMITNGILDASFDAMFSINTEGTILMVNKVGCEKFGWNEEELLGSNISMIMDFEHSSKHDDYLKTYLATKEKKMIGTQRELQAKRKDGTLFPIELGISEIEQDGFHMFAAFVRDLSGIKEIEDIIAEKARTEALLLNCQRLMQIM